MKSFFRAVSVLLLIVCCSAAASAAPKGHLVIIGGGTRPDNVMGESSVMVVRPSKKSIRTNRNNYYGARMDVRLYLEGDRFTLRTVRQQ